MIKSPTSPVASTILNTDLFSNLLPGEKESVLASTGTLTLRKGESLFSPGERAEHLYLLRHGLVKVLKPGHDGEDGEIARFTAGDIIGDFDFARNAEYDARAEALEDSSLVVFPDLGLTLDTFAYEAPHIASKILINSASMVISRIMGARKLIMENMSWVQELHRKIHEDPGTGLWKQSFLTDEISSRLMEEPMALIMLKPDRFKVLVDALGHGAGDKAMVKIAAILKSIPRRLGRGWAMRFRSNETGILINRCEPALAESLAKTLSEAIAAIPPVPLEGQEDFSFSGSIAWGVWPLDEKSWDTLLENTYKLLMDIWRTGGKKIVRYERREKGP